MSRMRPDRSRLAYRHRPRQDAAGSQRASVGVRIAPLVGAYLEIGYARADWDDNLLVRSRRDDRRRGRYVDAVDAVASEKLLRVQSKLRAFQ